jgi:predicted dienelactone hydrolase
MIGRGTHPVRLLPRPTGPYGIGTLVYHWVDEARPEFFSAAHGDRRELMVQVWYPAHVEPSAPRRPYVDDAKTLVDLARLIGLPGSAFDHLQHVETHAQPAAPMATEEATYPLVLFSHGRCGFRQHNTVQVEELVSRGYVVATIDHPYAASGVVLPDGRLIPFDPRLLPPWPQAVRPGLDRPFADGVLPYLEQDAVFVLDQLEALNDADPHGILTGRLDLGRRGMFGVSLGGMITAEACRIDARLQAGLVMDVWMPEDVVETGLRQPMMWLSRPATTMRLEGWDEVEIDATQASMRAVFQRLPGDGYIVLVPDMFHIDFSDGRLLSPLIASRRLCGPIDGERARTILNAYTVAFFDRHLRGLPAPLIDGRSAPFPEVLSDTHRMIPA